MYSKVTFKKAEPTDAPLLAATRQKAWAATYRGIYPDEMQSISAKESGGP